MTLAQIMTLALRQLDEDPADISEYDDLFRMYANEGHRIAVTEYLKPRTTLPLHSNEAGHIPILGTGIARVIEVRRKTEDGRMDLHVPFHLDATGAFIVIPHRNADVGVLAEMQPKTLENDSDEPMLPDWAHSAIVDYICYRHLLNGNMAKQQRGQQYLSRFYDVMRRITPVAYGSVRREINLYGATDIRRWW